jgi:hypothetical protein
MVVQLSGTEATSLAPRQQFERPLANTACALERFYIARGEYPETLLELVPSFLTQVPVDPADGESLRYRRTSDSRYRVYSIGSNLIDDGGRISVKSSRSKGDWVWAYTAEYLPKEEE